MAQQRLAKQSSDITTVQEMLDALDVLAHTVKRLKHQIRCRKPNVHITARRAAREGRRILRYIGQLEA